MHLPKFTKHLLSGSKQAMQQLRRHLAMFWQHSLTFLPMVIRLVLMHLPQSTNGRQQAFPLAIKHLPQALQQLSTQNLRLLQQILQGLQNILAPFLQPLPQGHSQGQQILQVEQLTSQLDLQDATIDHVMQQVHTKQLTMISNPAAPIRYHA